MRLVERRLHGLRVPVTRERRSCDDINLRALHLNDLAVEKWTRALADLRGALPIRRQRKRLHVGDPSAGGDHLNLDVTVRIGHILAGVRPSFRAGVPMPGEGLPSTCPGNCTSWLPTLSAPHPTSASPAAAYDNAART